MKKINNIAIIEPVSYGVNEYLINGVRYTVESRFVPYDIKRKQTTFYGKIKRIITSDFIPLTANTDEDILETNNVCLTAGKEDYAV
ncbi:MAG: hypothetical protein ACI4I3_03300 [Acutalibacteraceae bacterium]